MTPGDLLASAEMAKSAKERQEAADLLAPWTIGRAVERLHARHVREATAPAGGMRWPGVPSEDPAHDVHADPAPLTPTGVRLPPWVRVWRMLGNPRADWLAMLVGATGRGKSGLALTVGESIACDGVPVLVASTEMGSDECAARLLALRADPPPWGGTMPGDPATMPRGGPAWRAVLAGPPLVDPDDLTEAGRRLVSECPHLYVWAPSRTGCTVDALERTIHALAMHHGCAPFVVLDYVQRLAGGDESERRGSVASTSLRLRGITRPSEDGRYPGCGMVVLSSTSRAHYGTFTDSPALLRALRGGWRFTGKVTPGKPASGGKPARPARPRKEYAPPVPLEGLGKESGELEYDASAVLCLTCDIPETDSTMHATATARTAGHPAEVAREGYRRGLLAVAKNRAGHPGGWAVLDFHAPSGRWEALPPDLDRIARAALLDDIGPDA